MEFISSIPLFGGFLSTLIAFVAVLSVIIFIHEYGHYIVGRWCGIQAEVFSMGFGPILKSWQDRRGTRWQIAAIPFGGYVKFLGDADGSSRNDPAAIAAMDAHMRARSFHGAKLYKKALTVAAGPVANFLLSTSIFAAVVMATGIATNVPTLGKLKPLPSGAYALQQGDVIEALNGQPISDYAELYDYSRQQGEVAPAQIYTVMRGDKRLDVPGPFPLLPLIENIQPQSAAMAAGLEVGDLIQSVDGQKITAFRQLQDLVTASQGRELDLGVWRDGKVLDFHLTPKIVDMPDGEGGFTKRTLIGITGGLFFEPVTRTPGPVEALKMGLVQTGDIISGSLNGLYHMVSGSISACNLQGPVGIAKTSGDAASQGLASFVWFIAVLSTAIGLLNLFPIPVLDGGHLVFFAYEALAGRAPSQRALNALMSLGLFFIVTLMVFALGNDFMC
ncbi:MAG: RIP metalloprotease RseP [Rhodobacteraceae bacterium]|nr:RIP metalloprotease RseP [Paracoccaceae bacterium]